MPCVSCMHDDGMQGLRDIHSPTMWCEQFSNCPYSKHCWLHHPSNETHNTSTERDAHDHPTSSSPLTQACRLHLPNGADRLELLQYALDNFELLTSRTLEHIALVAVAVGIATLTGVPIGIAITRNK